MCLDTTEISAAEKNYSTPFMFRAKSESVFIDSPFFFQAEDGIRDQPRSRGLGDVYKRQPRGESDGDRTPTITFCDGL